MNMPAIDRWEGFWEVPEVWLGETVYIVGGGPSIMDTDLTPIHDKPVIGVNNAFELGDWVDVIFFGDKGWWSHHGEKALTHHAMVVTNIPSMDFVAAEGIKLLGRTNRLGIHWKTRKQVCWNKNGGACAINLALHFGASRIVLLGFDMKASPHGKNGGHNWHDFHSNYKKPRKDIYDVRFIPVFDFIKEDLEKMQRETGRRIEVLNATPGSALKAFPMVKLEETL